MIINPHKKIRASSANSLKEQHKNPSQPNLNLIKHYLECKQFEEALVVIKEWLKDYGLPNSKQLSKVSGFYINILIKLQRWDEGFEYLEEMITKQFKGSFVRLYTQLLEAKNHSEYSETYKPKSEMTGRFIPDIGTPPQGINKIAMYKSSYIYTATGSRYNVTLSQGQQISSPNRITMVSCGKYFYSILDEKGLIYNVGNEACVTNNSFPVVTLQRFTSIAAGGFFCTAVSNKGELFTWGKSVFGCLGHGLGTLDQEVHEITKVQFFDNKRIKKVSAFGWNTAAITEDGELYTWGRNHRGQIGIERAQVEECNRLFSSKVSKATFLPEIKISLSSVSTDYQPFVNKQRFSDIHISKDDGTVFYVHNIFLITLQNPKLTQYLVNLKSEKDNITHISFEDFLLQGYQLSHPEIANDEAKSFISNIVQSDTISNHGFEEFLYFLYTNRIKSSNYTNDLNTLADIFNFSPLKVFIEHKLIISVPPSASTKLTETLEYYLSSGQLSDIVLKAGDLSIPTHKVILAARSNYFKITDQTSVLELDEEDKKTIPSLLRYLYVDRFKFDSTNISGNDILSLLNLAIKYQLTRLQEGCQKLISGSVSVKNAINLLKYAEKNNIVQLKNFLICFISNNYSSIPKEEITALPSSVQALVHPVGDDVRVTGGQYEPLRILQDTIVTDVAVGEKMMVALDDQNKLYQLGRGSGDVFKPKLTTIALPTKEQVVSISCGSSHACVMTSDQKFYGWGAGFEGQLKTVRNKFFEDPVPISFDSISNNVTCGTHSTFVWSDNSEYPFPPSKGTPITYYDSNDVKVDISSIQISNDTSEVAAATNTESKISSSGDQPFDCILELISYSMEKSKLEDKEEEEQEQQAPEYKTLYVHSSKLPPHLLSKFAKASKTDGELVKLKLFEFPYEMVKTYFSYQYSSALSIQGNDFVEFINMAVLFKDYVLAKHLYEKIKYLLSPELTCNILISIYEKSYQDHLAFLVLFLIKYIKACRGDVIKTLEYQSLPYEVLTKLSS
ncbi:hypothetical protein CYY_001241 [Polysphondylium violaceum]|uniref:BTB domain-containing protein n=1 Tax=Polysphondylium violaceum TaxID=133409 RepID=A0A8J4Q064_9MYCE|nr:hypothetical protein CYY_001241 [Polysphondylium violaceum]